MVAAAAVLVTRAHATPVADEPPRQSVRQLVLRLTAEAHKITKTGGDVPETPDFAERAPATVDMDELRQVLVKRAHRDPFTDAYVRWQLTSFDSGLPEMDEDGFLHLLSELPALLENPRADPAMVTLLERAEVRGPLPQRDLTRLRATVEQLDAHTETAERLNHPAVAFRAWLETQVDPAGLRCRLLLVETCAATVGAAWSTRDVKTRITRVFTDADDEAQLTQADRRRLAHFVQRLGGYDRQFVNKVTFLASGAVQVTLSTAAVDRDDADRWIGLLNLMDGKGNGFPAPPQDEPLTVSLSQAIRMLTDEAKESLRTQRLPRAGADFAAGFDETPWWPRVWSRIVRPAHGDPFVDAYVRWQLTSFQPAGWSMPIDSLENLLVDLPPLADNPRADRRLITRVNRTIGTGELNEATQQAWQQRLDELATQTRRVEDLNLPGLQLRDWARQRLPQRGAGPLLVELERCAALAAAGWSTDRVKARLDELFGAAGRSRRFSDDDRRWVANAAQRMPILSRVYVQSAGIDESLLVVNFAETGIYDFDVRRWVMSLRAPSTD